MTDYITVIRLIALNAHDFIRVSKKYMASIGHSAPVNGSDENVNHLQAKMLGWAYLLNIWTGEYLKQYGGEMTDNEQFRNSVLQCWDSYIVRGELNE